MNCLMFSLVIFCTTAGGLALLALLPQHQKTTQLSNMLGPAGAVTGCLLGLCGVMGGSPQEALSLSWGLPVGRLSFVLDPLSRLFLLPVFGLGIACAISGYAALRHTTPQEHNLGAHWLFYLLLITGMTVVITAHDAVLFLLAWEVMSLSLFFLVDFNDGDKLVRDACWVYLVAAHLGALFLFALFLILWNTSGSTDFSAFMALAHGPLTPLLFVLALIGFGAKADMVPMHIWLPEVHPAAPSHVSAILSGAMSNAGLYGIIRSLSFLGPADEFSPWWGWTVLAIGLVTGLIGILKAMAQNNIKRMLAYSSIENMGVMLMGIGAGIIGLIHSNVWIATLGFAGTLFHMINHASFKGLLFLCTGEVFHSTGTINMQMLGGLQKKIPFVGSLFALGAAAIACLPPLNGFSSELVLSLSLARGATLSGIEHQLGLLFALAGLALISGLSAATFAKTYGTVFLGTGRTGFAEHVRPPSRCSLLPLAPLAAYCVLGGLPQCFAIVIDAVLSVIKLPAAQVPAAMASLNATQDTLGIVAGIGFGGILITFLFLGFRKMLLKNKTVARSSTWSCGYQYGTPRIQYTDTSFSEPVAKLFAGAMGIKIRKKLDSDSLFPHGDELHISAPDRLLRGLYTPLFETFEKICNELKIVQHGRIHLYILYILVTVIALLFWGFWGGNA